MLRRLRVVPVAALRVPLLPVGRTARNGSAPSNLGYASWVLWSLPSENTFGCSHQKKQLRAALCFALKKRAWGKTINIAVARVLPHALFFAAFKPTLLEPHMPSPLRGYALRARAWI